MNSSGITPLDHRVLIKQDDPEDRIGNILLPPKKVEEEKYAMTNATVIAIGSLAWAEAKHDAERFGVDFNAPVPGTRIKVGKYAGTRYEGSDGKEYTIINDEDVVGILS